MIAIIKMVWKFIISSFRFQNASRLSFVIAFLLLASCATYTPPGSNWEGYGFFSGWLHGLLLPFALLAKIMSFFLSLIGLDYMEKFEIIGNPNSGTSYYIGYGIGLIGLIFGGQKTYQ